MVCVYFFLMFIACVNAAQAPNKAIVSLIKDSTIGFSVANDRSKTYGVFEENRGDNGEVEIQEGGRRPDFSILEKVIFGAAFAINKSVGVGVIKNNSFVGKNPIEEFKELFKQKS